MEVSVVNRQRGRRISPTALAAFLRGLARALRVAEPAGVAVCLVSDRRMRELNREFRGLDRPTDVLSFPDGEPAGSESERHLGDIVIAVPTAARQAHERGHSVAREIKLLALHGFLHLLGYDHERDDGEMMRLQRRLERRLLRAAGSVGAR